MTTFNEPVIAGYTRGDGRHANIESVVCAPSAVLAAGATIGPVFECGDKGTLRVVMKSTAKAGTSPTLDCTMQTSHDCVSWRTLGTAFVQQTNAAAGYTMSAVAPTGTSPPALTLTGTQVCPVSLSVQALTSDVRGTWTGQYSTDAGVTWTAFTSAATVAVLDTNGVATGLVLNFANTASTNDNVWTAHTTNFEAKVFAGCDRYVRAVFAVGGSATPTMTASVTGEAV